MGTILGRVGVRMPAPKHVDHSELECPGCGCHYMQTCSCSNADIRRSVESRNKLDIVEAETLSFTEFMNKFNRPITNNPKDDND